MGLPPVVCGLLFYMLFSGVGPFRHLHLLFTVKIMILAQVVLITPIVTGNMETYVSNIAADVRETAVGLQLSKWKTFLLLTNECIYKFFPSICWHLLVLLRKWELYQWLAGQLPGKQML